jgi:F0F1-type ATP synthase gamma subunit
MNCGLTGEFNSTIAKLALANHGHSEKSQTDITSGGEKIKNDWHIHPVTTK